MSSSNSEWVQYYQEFNLASQGQGQGQVVPPQSRSLGPAEGSSGMISSAAIVTTSGVSAGIDVGGGGGGGSTGTGTHLIPEGRVSKPTRRRRASRTAPTTLLNTDTSNFRAMVQQFTGVPSTPFTFGSNYTSVPSLNFGNATNTLPPHGYYNHYHQHQHQPQQQQHQQHQYIFPFNANATTRPNSEEDSSDGFLMNNNIPSQVFPRPSSSNNGYNI